MKTRQQLQVMYLRRVIQSKEYTASRADAMNNRIHYWKESKKQSNTKSQRDFCDTMIEMYLKRYIFYVTEKLNNIKKLPEEMLHPSTKEEND